MRQPAVTWYLRLGLRSFFHTGHLQIGHCDFAIPGPSSVWMTQSLQTKAQVVPKDRRRARHASSSGRHRKYPSTPGTEIWHKVTDNQSLCGTEAAPIQIAVLPRAL